MLYKRQLLEKREKDTLAAYAVLAADSRGRVYREPETDFRTCFQRDKDRIIHSTAFRRLEYKTQVFVNHEGDHYRTRLTHSLEVQQIARSCARSLGLNEDLVEAIALAHDLGHGPFGHAGEWALADLMRGHGGFEHNRQTLRIVEKLEESYAAFPGLNLTFEVREGLKKHPEPGTRGRAPGFFCLEAQLVDLADEIAYDSHDLDDGLRAGMFREEELGPVKLWREAAAYAARRYRSMTRTARIRFAIRLLIHAQVQDLLAETVRRLKRHDVRSLAHVLKAPRRIVDFSPALSAKKKQLKAFLHENLYTHYRVVRMTQKGMRVIKEVFNAYRENPGQLPPDARRRGEKEGLPRTICDYVAGMTDRYVLDEHRRLFHPDEKV